MLRPDCILTFTRVGRSDPDQFEFRSINDLEIHSSWKNLTDTGELVIAKKYNWEGNDVFGGANPLIKIGDKVSIQLGYNAVYNLAFTGYISALNTEQVTKMKLEDELWLLKRSTLTAKMYKSVSLKTLINDVIGTKIPFITTVDYTDVGKVTIQNGATPALVLEMLRKTYHIESFVRSGTLYVGIPYLYNYPATKETALQHDFEFQENIIESSLEWKTKDTYPMFAKATCIYNEGKQNKKLTVKVGDLGGAQKTFTYYQKYTEEGLKEIALRDLNKCVYNGFYGKFATFGEPFVRHGDRISMIDKKNPEKNGVYFAKSVEYNFGWGGYFQEIELGARVL